MAKQPDSFHKVSDAHYHVLFEGAAEGILVADLKTRQFKMANPAIGNMLGYSVDELMGMSVSDIHPKADLKVVLAEFEAQARGEKVLVTNIPCLRKDGTIFLADVKSAALSIDGCVCNIGFFTDVTERKLAEDALLAEKNRAQQYLDIAGTIFIVLQANQTVSLINRKGCELLGYPENEIIGKNWFDHFLPAAVRDRVKDVFDQLIAGRIEPVEYFENVVATRDSGVRTIAWHNTVLRDEAGCITATLSSGQDITEAKQSEEHLVRLAAAIDHVAEHIMITDVSGRIVYANPAFHRNTGYGPAEVVGRTPRLLKSGEHDPAFYRKLWKTISKGDKWTGRFINKKKDGTLFEEEASITPVRNRKGEIINYVAVKRDITDQRALERKLRQAQKMEAIGTLAGGIAHDFNNILASIIGFTELAVYDLAKESGAAKNLEKVLRSAGRAKELVGQILTFSRQTEEKKRPLHIGPIVKEALKLLRASIPSTIDIRSHIERDVGLVDADPTQMHQIVMNLCTNAAHAMDEKGHLLEVGLKQVDLNFVQAAKLNLEPGTYVQLRVRDTGHGMELATVERIFDPYFTTKSADRGTGLGLAVVHGIVTNCSGAIDVSSQLNVGTVFDIYFPCVEKKDTGRASEVESVPPSLPVGKEQILLVDDEQMVADFTAEILGHLGYRVVLQTDPVQALDHFRKFPEQFDLVISDMTMPGMGGEHLARELMKIRPEMPVILCTGYSEKMDSDKAGQMGVKAYLLKPLKMKDLAFAVREVLDGREQRART